MHGSRLAYPGSLYVQQWLQDPSLMHQQGNNQQPAHHHQRGPQHPQHFNGGQGGYANGPQGPYTQHGPNGYAYDRSTCAFSSR